MIDKIRKKLSYTTISPLFYTEQLSQAYLTHGVAGGTLKEKTAFITGATGGIGAAVCSRMAAEGCNLIISGRNDKKLNEAKENICRKYPSIDIRCAVMDQKDTTSINNCIDNLKEERFPDIFINVAGIYTEVDKKREFRNVSKAEFQNVWDTNYVGIAEFTKQVAKEMVISNPKGCVVNISSICSIFKRYQYTPYGISKSALTQFALELKKEYPTLNIKTVLPGSVATIMGNLKQGDNISRKCNILHHPALPEEIAALVAFLCSDVGCKVTNSAIVASACEVL